MVDGAVWMEFFILMWSLMSRADSVDTIMLQPIEWSEDCLIVEEQGHKGDQTGTDKFGKHDVELVGSRNYISAPITKIVWQNFTTCH
ncbi:hypothetical protein PPTG_24750 [Phytophthora nicotianae INRA-310]|uniref:Pectate lyase n=1 Tax=Phytophthora nicotianae (strain INRA-310) TaxID=761204 RepID=W2PB34_PHYN3|nr:hypothetical protein PPTG_24750 [Phytophthora nicotianae INRA-310]ETM98041.1 hypothetical protein PPTG_24750 [Phytophthora nicotianae INRA-310]